ncbi:putative endochitinase precursor [Talaromyces proteolyticus]|uniref:Endochitinase n=1 Tax=Talaromyces proteolyticus TaxID=1131652 RepID=A0AAD4KFV6_9EURO|nr:putative endochitinase precursor [Talaromyces proteolyticus]KAH8690716.1 putative endochitinase precursor [Talaromyces proteolyticus]
MHLSTLLVNLGITASAVLAAPHTLHSRAPGGEVAVYWGQNGGGTIENNDLSAYCTSSSGIDILILAFLYEYGNGNEIASGTIGQSCYISPAGEPQNCDALASAIETCKSKGIKIILSLGGADGAYSLQSETEAQTLGQNLWAAYGNVANGSVPRPFGTTFVDGWDFDIEANSGNQYYQYMISTLRSNFASDPSHTYYITGAPQCVIPEPNMEEIITNATFDYLWVQFYNNPSCSNPNPINYNAWVNLISGGPSANAKIFIGVPASTTGATGTTSGEAYYFEPSALATLVGEYDTNAHWGGIMMWSAGFSDANVNNGCTYAQEAKSILNSGSPCSGSGPGTSTTTITTATSTTTATKTATTTSSATSTATGTPVAQWGQCGGEGYTGSTVCASPYKCVEESVWWSSCQ